MRSARCDHFRLLLCCNGIGAEWRFGTLRFFCWEKPTLIDKHSELCRLIYHKLISGTDLRSKSAVRWYDEYAENVYCIATLPTNNSRIVRPKIQTTSSLNRESRWIQLGTAANSVNVWSQLWSTLVVRTIGKTLIRNSLNAKNAPPKDWYPFKNIIHLWPICPVRAYQR